MTESVTKAIEMEDVEDGSLTSSLLDDVFFIVRKSIRRSITSSSVDCVCAMLNNGCTLLETDYFTHINKVIKVNKSLIIYSKSNLLDWLSKCWHCGRSIPISTNRLQCSWPWQKRFRSRTRHTTCRIHHCFEQHANVC